MKNIPMRIAQICAVLALMGLMYTLYVVFKNKSEPTVIIEKGPELTTQNNVVPTPKLPLDNSPWKE
jgi:hypothetical protein